MPSNMHNRYEMISIGRSRILTFEEFRTADALLTICDDYNTFCCGQDSNARACCNSNNGTFKLTGGAQVVSPNFPPPVIEIPGSSMATAKSTVTTVVNATVTANTSLGNSCTSPKVAAVVLGSVLFIATVVLAIVGTLLRQNRKELARPGRRRPMS